MVSAEVIRPASMAAHACFSPAARKSCGQAATLDEGGRMTLQAVRKAGLGPEFLDVTRSKRGRRRRRSATLHAHPLTPEV